MTMQLVAPIVRGESLAERLWRHSMPVPECGCWIWLSSTNKRYGQLNLRKSIVSAHRLSWQVFRGEIPEGMHVLHRCDVRECINPDHLYLGSDLENARDRVAHGTQNVPPRMLGSNHPMALIDEVTAIEIKNAVGTHTAISKRFGVSRSTVGHIKTGRQWSHV